MYLQYSPLTELLLPYFLGAFYFFIAIWMISETQETLPLEPLMSVEISDSTPRSTKRSKAPTKTLAGALKKEHQRSLIDPPTSNKTKTKGVANV